MIEKGLPNGNPFHFKYFSVHSLHHPDTNSPSGKTRLHPHAAHIPDPVAAFQEP